MANSFDPQREGPGQGLGIPRLEQQSVHVVIDALGDALARDHRADAVTGDEDFELHVRDFGINRHASRAFRRSARAAG